MEIACMVQQKFPKTLRVLQFQHDAFQINEPAHEWYIFLSSDINWTALIDIE